MADYKIPDKNTNISNKNTLFDQNQTTIEEFFLQIEDRTIYKKMTKRNVVQTCKFFLHSLKQIRMNDRIKLFSLSRRLKLFQASGILSMFDIKINTNNKNILIDKMSFEEVLIFLPFGHLQIYYR